MRYNGAYSATLAARAVSSAIFISLVWEAAHTCFEVYATQVRLMVPSSFPRAMLTPSFAPQPITVSQFSPSPNQALLSGLRSSDPYYQVRRVFTPVESSPMF
jgi:nucleoporin NDC1